jgi:Skp family chaperone for outer membrane proteins
MGHMSAVPDVPEGGGASRTTDPAVGTSSATDVSLREYMEAMRAADQRLDEERDRRYAELAIEREKALAIKEKADERALNLQAETQKYKDEKANELREQIASERGDYLTREEYNRAHIALEDKVDAAVKPLAEYVTGQQGRQQGIGMIAAVVVGGAVVISTLMAVLVKVLGG